MVNSLLVQHTQPHTYLTAQQVSLGSPGGRGGDRMVGRGEVRVGSGVEGSKFMLCFELCWTLSFEAPVMNLKPKYYLSQSGGEKPRGGRVDGGNFVQCC